MAGKDRPEGCVVRDSYLEESSEVPSVSLERHSTRVCVPSLWSGGCSEAVHEGYEAGCCPSSARRHSSDHLFGRSSVHESIAGGPGTGYGNHALLAGEPRVCCKFRKVVLRSNQQLEFLGFLVNSRDMTLLLPDCKVEAIKAHCLCLLTRQDVSVRELSQLIEKLTASIQAIFPAPLHYRSLQHLKHQALAQQNGFNATIALSSEAREELQWWLAHLDAWNDAFAKSFL